LSDSPVPQEKASAPGREAEPVVLSGRFAAWLALTGTTVLLAIDEVVAQRVASEQFADAVGTCDQRPGAATGYRVAAHAVGSKPSALEPGADAEIRLGTPEMVVGYLPAVDVLASRSSLLDSATLPPEHRAPPPARPAPF
jgi:hypothetical protein